jgi:hypothetical protein
MQRHSTYFTLGNEIDCLSIEHCWLLNSEEQICPSSKTVLSYLIVLDYITLETKSIVCRENTVDYLLAKNKPVQTVKRFSHIWVTLAELTWKRKRLLFGRAADACSNGPNRVCVSHHPHLRTETVPVSETLWSLEYRTMDEVQKPSNSKWIF